MQTFFCIFFYVCKEVIDLCKNPFFLQKISQDYFHVDGKNGIKSHDFFLWKSFDRTNFVNNWKENLQVLWEIFPSKVDPLAITVDPDNKKCDWNRD